MDISTAPRLFIATEYTTDHCMLPRTRVPDQQLKYYTSGHMIYLHDEDRVKLKSNIGSLHGRRVEASSFLRACALRPCFSRLRLAVLA